MNTNLLKAIDAVSSIPLTKQEIGQLLFFLVEQLKKSDSKVPEIIDKNDIISGQKELCEFLCISAPTAGKLIKVGKIIQYKTGTRKTYYSKSQLKKQFFS